MKRDSFYLISGWVLTIFSYIWLFLQGIQRSYFHQDDVIALAVVANWQGWKTLFHLNNEHLNITFWPVLRILWLNFGLNFSVYLAFSMLLHLLVLVLIFIITYKLTKSLLYSSLPVWGMVINPNWFAVIWWIDGQMFILTTISALISYWLILKTKEHPSNFQYVLVYLISLLPGLSWGVGLVWPTLPLVVFGIDYKKKRLNRLGLVLLAAQVSLIGIYKILIGNNLGVNTDPVTWLSNPLAIINFALVGISNTLIGRWLWPQENKAIRIICLFVVLVLFSKIRPIKKLISKDVVFGAIVVIGSFLTYAIPRWKFGIGHAMANYYAYYPLSFLLISFSVFLKKLNPKGLKKTLLLSVFILHIGMSWLGFQDWARGWVVRPGQTKAYFQKLISLQPDECLENVYLPDFIIPQKIWRLDYLWPIFKKGPFPSCKINTRRLQEIPLQE